MTPAERPRVWNVTLERMLETPSSWIGFGSRAGRPVVLKVSRPGSDETRSGDAALGLGQAGIVAVLAHTSGAVLLERLDPGTPLTRPVERGDDARATDVLAEVAARLESPGPAAGFPTVADWGAGFDRYLASGAVEVPGELVTRGREVFRRLAHSQRRVRLLHGDLQHDNVLYDRRRGWVAIDPKGVNGEPDYELGAALRNPPGFADRLADPSVTRDRIGRFVARLGVDPDRVLGWAFAQAVLSMIWTWEDGGSAADSAPAARLAHTLAPMLPATLR